MSAGRRESERERKALAKDRLLPLLLPPRLKISQAELDRMQRELVADAGHARAYLFGSYLRRLEAAWADGDDARCKVERRALLDLFESMNTRLVKQGSVPH